MSFPILKNGGMLVLIGSVPDRNAGEMVGLLNEYFWTNARELAGERKPNIVILGCYRCFTNA